MTQGEKWIDGASIDVYTNLDYAFLPKRRCVWTLQSLLWWLLMPAIIAVVWGIYPLIWTHFLISSQQIHFYLFRLTSDIAYTICCSALCIRKSFSITHCFVQVRSRAMLLILIWKHIQGTASSEEHRLMDTLIRAKWLRTHVSVFKISYESYCLWSKQDHIS